MLESSLKNIQSTKNFSEQENPNTMKTFEVDIKLMPLIRELFNGYIFRRTEEGKGYVRADKTQVKTMKKLGIELKEVEDE